MSGLPQSGHRCRRGAFSLTETAVVLGVVGVLTAGIMELYGNMREGTDASVFVQQIMLTIQNVREFHQARPLPDNDIVSYGVEDLRHAGVFPEDVCNATCVSAFLANLHHIYGGQINYRSNNWVAGVLGDNQFQLQMDEVHKRGCVELGMRLGSNAAKYGLIRFKIGSNRITSFPMTIALLDTICSSTTSNSIILTLKINI